MNKEQLKKWLPEITYWINGGDLYVYDPIDDTWNLKTAQTFRTDQIYVIKDKHFEARKDYALGEKIESADDSNIDGYWAIDKNPKWLKEYSYRPKLKEPTYDYHFTYRIEDVWYMSIGRWQGLKEAMHFIVGNDITRFKPSKRIRK